MRFYRSFSRLFRSVRPLLALLLALLVLCEAGCGTAPVQPHEDETRAPEPSSSDPRPDSSDTETQPDDPQTPDTPSSSGHGNPVLSVSYEYVDGRFEQVYDVGLVAGNTSTVQEAGQFAESSLILTDSVMSYVSTLDMEEPPVASWVRHKDSVDVGIMIAINRGGTSYLNQKKSNYDDIQMDKSGNYIVHTPNTAWYMVPSSNWNDYVCENLERLVTKYDLPFIVLEEPEMWHRSGYSAAFKAEWQSYYGTPWEDQTQSPDACYRSMQLKTYLFQRLLNRIGTELHEKHPDLRIYIASHSTLSYNAWAITSGLDSYLSTGVLDGFIGQTWTDTIRTHVLYNGSAGEHPFESAYLEYASYLASQNGTDFYALADPMSDNSALSEADCRKYYLETLTGMLMNPAIQRFEVLPWITRAFSGVSNTYKTIQLNIQKMQKDLVSRDVTLTGGTPGITYLLSDSLSWVATGNRWTADSSTGFYGVTLPLITAGIPVQFASLDTLTSVDQLKDVSLLILTLDNILPRSEDCLKVLSDWVKAGGSLVVISGYSQYWEMDSAWWPDSPLASLFEQMGLESVDIDYGAKSASLYGVSLDKAYAPFVLNFDNLPADAEELASNEGKTIAFSKTVGDGEIQVYGVSAANFATVANGSEAILKIVQDAVDSGSSEFFFSESDLLMARHGPYTVAHAFAGQVLDGRYLDLYDDELTIVEDPLLSAGSSVLYYAIDDLDLSVPHVAFTGGRVVGDILETAGKTEFTLTGPTAAFVASRLFCQDGLYPASVTAVRADNGREIEVEYNWNNAFDSLYLLSEIPSGGVTYTITWGTTPVQDGAPYQLVEESVITTNANLDRDYLIENTAMSNSAQRYCDLATYLIYEFDISDLDHVTFYLSISQNYLLEVSDDNEHWTVAYDYSQGGKIPHIENADNKTILTIVPSEFGIEDTLYIRLRNAYPTIGWGGSVYRISWKYRVYPD